MRLPIRRLFKFDDENLGYLNDFMFDVYKCLAANVDFGDGTIPENVSCDFVNVQFGTAGTELSAAHNLYRVPTGCWLVAQNMSGDIYTSTVPTSAYYFLKSNTNSLSGKAIII